MYGCTAMRIQLTQTSHFLACTQRHAKTIRWWYSLYIAPKGVLHASTKFKHLLWAMYKKKPHQNPTCSLFSWRAHTWHVAGTTCTSDSSHLRKTAATLLMQGWKQAGLESSRQNLHDYSPEQHQKKWHLPERVCRHLWVSLGLDNSEMVSRFSCQPNIFGPGKMRFC